MRRGRKALFASLSILLVVLLLTVTAFSQAGDGRPERIKIAVATYLSGAAATAQGIPMRNGYELLIDELNAGNVPAPYNQIGIGGVPIEVVYVDENTPVDQQVAIFRRLVLEENVDVVTGYIGSGNCLAVAPVADELRTLTVAANCGTSRIFEDGDYKYFFRTSSHQAADNIAAARYVLAVKPDLRSIAGINQDYSWGQDSWEAFRDSILQLKPDVQVVSVQYPRLFAGQYSSEISALLAARPDVIHSSFWGGDLESLLLQAAPRGLHMRSLMVLTAGDPVVETLQRNMPQGVVVGARGINGHLSPDNPLNEWFWEAYTRRYGVHPVLVPYHGVNALLGIKAAYEKAIELNGGRWPTTEEVIVAFEGLEFETPSGTIQMALAKGHQAVTGYRYAITGPIADGETTMTQVMEFGPWCVNPPEGWATADWIKAGFPGAKCD